MNAAREAYETYRKHAEAHLPPWDELPDWVKTAWSVTAAWLAGRWQGLGLHQHRLSAQNERLEKACRAVLLFHAGGDFDRTAWTELTDGKYEPTSKGVCDFVRQALGGTS